MARRTHRDVEVETIVEERAALLRHARAFVRQLPALIERGKLPGADASALRDRVLCFADGVATGLHRLEPDPAGVRAAMRAVLREIDEEEGR